MSHIQYLLGDATAPTGSGARVITHVCNDIGGWGRGFVVAVSRRWPQPEKAYRDWYAARDPSFRLGAVQFVEVGPRLWVANMIGQHGIKVTKAGPPVRYDALTECLKAVGERARREGATVHMPRIGCGLAGGEWRKVEEIITSELLSRGVEVFVYDLAPAGDAFELWRQDDGGNQFLVGAFPTRKAAEDMMRTYEDRGHKQVYWVKEPRYSPAP